ncbi:MAG: hypothetical protein OXD29_07670 [Roseovarius sp.]|nr:hypothetical protein [Roseovarius sp.]MCY4207815.1 hypothetical protein [Roseovarius sp.]
MEREEKALYAPAKYVWCTTVWQNARGSDKGFTENRLKMHCKDYFPDRPADLAISDVSFGVMFEDFIKRQDCHF